MKIKFAILLFKYFLIEILSLCIDQILMNVIKLTEHFIGASLIAFGKIKFFQISRIRLFCLVSYCSLNQPQLLTIRPAWGPLIEIYKFLKVTLN